VIGIGAFAADRARHALGGPQRIHSAGEGGRPESEGRPLLIGQVLHPSPASPRANDDWGGKVKRELRELGACAC